MWFIRSIVLLYTFLLGELIKGLNAENEEDRDKAVAATDSFLSSDSIKALKKPAPDRTGVNRTVINRNAYNTPPQEAPGPSGPPGAVRSGPPGAGGQQLGQGALFCSFASLSCSTF